MRHLKWIIQITKIVFDFKIERNTISWFWKMYDLFIFILIYFDKLNIWNIFFFTFKYRKIRSILRIILHYMEDLDIDTLYGIWKLFLWFLIHTLLSYYSFILCSTWILYYTVSWWSLKNFSFKISTFMDNQYIN